MPELPPEMAQQMPPEMPMSPDQMAPEMPMDGMISQAPDESMALQMDEGEANATATKMIASAKKEMYGESFDTYMDVLQSSDNLVEDLAMISISLIVPQIEAASTQGGVPFDYLMDVSAEVVSEGYDMAVQTGTYVPSGEEEIERNQNITLTMVAGELGKEFGGSTALDQGRVANFVDSVVDGAYDNLPTQQEMEPQMPPEMPIGGMPV